MVRMFVAMVIFATAVFLAPFASKEQAPFFLMAIVVSLIVLILATYFAIKQDYEDIGKD